MPSLEEDVRRGLKAAELLGHDLIGEAKDHIDAELWRMFKETPPENKDRLAFISGMQYFHAKYFAFFQQAVTNGRIAQINLDAKKKSLRERMFG